MTKQPIATDPSSAEYYDDRQPLHLMDLNTFMMQERADDE